MNERTSNMAQGPQPCGLWSANLAPSGGSSGLHGERMERSTRMRFSARTGAVRLASFVRGSRLGFSGQLAAGPC